MKTLSYVVALIAAVVGLSVTTMRASTAATDITGTWELIIYYQPDDADFTATYVLKQSGEKISGEYHGMHGPAEVTGTVKAKSVAMTVTVHGSTAQFSGTLTSATTMKGTVTGTSDKPRQWSARKTK